MKNWIFMKPLFVYSLLFVFAVSVRGQIKFKTKTLIKDGRPYIEMLDGRLHPLVPMNILLDKIPLTGLERIKAEDFTKKINAGAAKPPDAFSLADDQTPIRDQTGRGTCWIFGTVAGMEAFYKREYKKTLDLSEQYLNHVLKSTGLDYPKKYQYENQSSYWGGGNSEAGVRGAMNYFTTEERYAPYKNDQEMDAIRKSIPEAGALDWHDSPADNKVTQAEVDAFEYSPKYIPPEARYHAVYGIASAVFLTQEATRDVDQMEKYLVGRHEVILDIETRWKYDNDKQMLDYDADPNAKPGGHVVLVVGYNRKEGYFQIKNSWNDGALLRVSYDFMRKASNGGAIITGVRPPNSAPDRRAYWIGAWKMEHDGWKGNLIIRRVTNRSTNEPTRLGGYIGADGSWHTVNGLILEDGQGVAWHIDFDRTENAPGLKQGQPFEIYVYSSEPRYASGSTIWNKTAFGCFLAREAYLSLPAKSAFDVKKWIGTWTTDHDGRKGTLEIKSVTKVTLAAVKPYFAVTASYLFQGKYLPISGTISAQTPHAFDFKITFAADNVQPFTLMFHTRDEQFSSGITTWRGTKFGVHAAKK